MELLDTLQDFVVAEHVGLLRSSSSPFIQELFAESDAEAAAAEANAIGKGARRSTKSAFKLNSVGAQFRKQLQARTALAAWKPTTLSCMLLDARAVQCFAYHFLANTISHKSLQQ